MNDLFGRDVPRPTVACDTVVFAQKDGDLQVLLIKRNHEPFKGSWALPGGFMEWGESCEQTAARELEEETGLKDLDLQQIGAFSEPGRDPRGTVVAVEFWTMLTNEQLQKAHIQAGDDAGDAAWFTVNKLPALAADHLQVLEKALQLMKQTKL